MKNLFFLLAASLFIFSACSDDDDDATKAKINIAKEKVLSDSISISWNPVEDAFFYNVIINPDDEFQSTSVDATATTFIFEDLKADTEYSIKVQAIAAVAGETEEESVIGEGNISITTEALPEEFLGTWKYTDSEETFSFKKDGTGEYAEGNSTQNIRWGIDNEKIIIRYYYNDDDSSSKKEFEYSFNEEKNVLTLKSGTNEFNFSLQEE